MAGHIVTEPVEEHPNPLYAEDDFRERLWSAFVADVKAQRFYRVGGWSGVVALVAVAMNHRESVSQPSFEARCCDFAETEGWDSVLTAIGRAMREKGETR